MKTILIIGSNAFSGSHCADLLLSAGYRVIGVSRSPEKNAIFLPYKTNANSGNFIFKQAHLAAEPEKLLALCDEYAPEAIINYAALNEIAPSHEHAADYFETNVVALAKFLIELRRRPYLQRYLHISTPEVYGNCVEPLPETAAINPSTPYAVSKAAADMYLMTLWKNHGFPVIFTRA
ncbi:SDR family oxidoreductase, partial [Patescibacteria group bacterium]